MKQLIKNKKIIIALVVVLIIVGVIVAVTLGFNMELKYRNTQNIELSIGKSFEVSDIKQITNEVLGQATVIQKLNETGDAVSISALEISEEQKNEIINKVNEKYETELKGEDINIINVPQIHLRDIIIKYMAPFLIAGGVILAYMLIRYSKIGVIKVLGNTIAVSLLAQCVLFSIMCITRIPVGRLTIPLVISVFILTITSLTAKYEDELEDIKETKEVK